MSDYISPMVLKAGDRILTRGNWWTLERVNHYEDGATMVRMWMMSDTGMDVARIERTVDLDSSALYLVAAEGESVQMGLYATVTP